MPTMTSFRPPGLLALTLVLVGALVACTAVGPPAGPPEPESELPSASESADPSSASPSARTSGSAAPNPRTSGTATPADRCAELVAGMGVREQVGQLFMVGISSSGPSLADAEALAESTAGSVIVLGNSTAGAAAVARVTDEARRVARAPSGVETMVAADQEGGQVQRLRGEGFRRIPSAYEQAELSNAELTSRAATWGRELKRAGVDADLAPVADVVPDHLRDVNAPIGQLERGYGADPRVVAEKVAAFVQGMGAAGVATAVKHFPGLGRVRGNTDFEAEVTDRLTRRGDEAWAGFQSGVDAGADMVMVSSATYSKVDGEHRAVFSREILGILRNDLGFGGVIISDDVAARALEDVRPAARALRFFRAGGDLAIVGDSSLVAAMADAVVDEAQANPAFAAQVEARATRVVKMKARRGLADC